MLFVDGSNLLVEMFKAIGATQRAERPRDDAIHLAKAILWRATAPLLNDQVVGPMRLIRTYRFGSIQGSPEYLEERRVVLHRAGYEPALFAKAKGRGEKGVDLAVAREMLIHGFHKNYDIAILAAGDADYVGLVQDLKRLGLFVIGMFFENAALSPSLRTSLDYFQPLQTLEHEQNALFTRVRDHVDAG